MGCTFFLQLAFEGIIGGFTSDIAIDDVTIAPGACTGTQGKCDFENDMCTWMNTVTGDNFDWLRKRGSTDTTGTGPSGDHTLGTFVGMGYILPMSLYFSCSRQRSFSFPETACKGLKDFPNNKETGPFLQVQRKDEKLLEKNIRF